MEAGWIGGGPRHRNPAPASLSLLEERWMSRFLAPKESWPESLETCAVILLRLVQVTAIIYAKKLYFISTFYSTPRFPCCGTHHHRTALVHYVLAPLYNVQCYISNSTRRLLCFESEIRCAVQLYKLLVRVCVCVCVCVYLLNCT